jgi:hypothetical protein
MTVKKRLVQIKVILSVAVMRRTCCRCEEKTDTDRVCFAQGITEAKVDKVLEAINKEKNFAFITGSDCLQIRQRIKRITTGCKSLDAMLGGGIESASLTEIYGEYRTGKTQVESSSAWPAVVLSLCFVTFPRHFAVGALALRDCDAPDGIWRRPRQGSRDRHRRRFSPRFACRDLSCLTCWLAVVALK